MFKDQLPVKAAVCIFLNCLFFCFGFTVLIHTIFMNRLFYKNTIMYALYIHVHVHAETDFSENITVKSVALK